MVVGMSIYFFGRYSNIFVVLIFSTILKLTSRLSHFLLAENPEELRSICSIFLLFFCYSNSCCDNSIEEVKALSVYYY